MALKRIYLLIFILLWSLGAHVYLAEKYNPATVEVHLNAPIEYEMMNNISRKNNISHHVMNYVMPYRQGNLIMTNGRDPMFQSMEILQGDFIAEIESQSVVIGDQVANQYFKSIDVIGRELEIFNETYWIAGVVKSNVDMYIPYRQHLLNERWKHVVFKYEAPEGAHFNIRIRDMNRDFALNDVTYYDTVIYQEKMYSYINYAVIALIGILFLLIKGPYHKLKMEVQRLREKYKQEKQRIEWTQYVKNEGSSLTRVLFMCLGGLVFLGSLFYMIKMIKVPREVIPNNLFSVASYINTGNNLFQLWVQRMQTGFNHILIDTIMLRLGLLISMLIFLVKWLYFESQAEVQGEAKQIESQNDEP